MRIGKALSLKRIFSSDRRRTPEGYTYIHDTKPQDVFIVGYPKSGNTWFQNLVAGVVHGVNVNFSPPALGNDLVPDVHYNSFYRRYSTPMFFKSHAMPNPAYRRVVYLLRDGRDAMVSFLHYAEALERRKLNFVEFVNNPIRHTSARWHEHVEAWAHNPFGADMMVIKYEDLLEQPVNELARFCEFIQLRRDRAQLAAAADAAQFSKLRKKEEKAGWSNSEHWPADKFFFRRGVAGSHKDEMPAEVLAAFLNEAGPTLRRQGYLVNEAPEAASEREEMPIEQPGFGGAVRVAG